MAGRADPAIGGVGVLSIGRLGRGQETYYLEKVAHGIEDYYTLSGEPAGRWLGTGAAALGLSGTVGDHELRLVLLGHDPRVAAPLVLGAGHPDRRPGFDLTFSSPKGVSLIGLLGGPEARAAVMAAHRDAVVQAVGYLERHAAWVRRGHGGVEHERAGGFVAAAFDHRSSRAGDPQLHTHVLVANLGQDRHGRWSALFGRVLYHQARTAGFLYQAALRANLTRSLGLEWRPAARGMAEPAGIDDWVLRAFSSRRNDIELALEEQGARSSRAAQVAAYRTREAKAQLPGPEDLLARWEAGALELGLVPDGLDGLVRPGSEPAFVLENHLDVLLGPDGLTCSESSFDRRAVLRSLAERAELGASVHELESAADAVLSRREVVELTPRTGLPEARRWSTRELLAVEARLVSSAVVGRGRGMGVVAPRQVDAALAARPSLATDQRAMVRHLVSSGDAVATVVGPAGSGKTYALDAARAAWQASGHHVLGVALAGRAAIELSAGAGLPSSTLARFVSDAEAPGGQLPPRSVVVCDEAAMVGTRLMARLFAVAERDGAQLVLVGDHRQLPEIEAGGVFAGLVARLGAAELTTNRRQHEAWERAVLAELRAGDVGVAVQAYNRNGRITITDTAGEARRRLVADWMSARQAGAQAVMLAVHRDDVDELNARARLELRHAGLLGGEELDVAGRRYAVGDELMPLRNDRRLGLVNGVRAVVVDIEPGSVVVELTSDRRVSVPVEYVEAGHLAHSYACTVHKFQGATVDRSFVLGNDALYREAGYVGMGRARLRTDLYLVSGPGEEDLGHGRGGPDKTDAVGDLLAALRQSRAQEMAIEGIDRGKAPERGVPGRADDLGRAR